MLSYRIFMQEHRFVVEVTYPSGTTKVAGTFHTKSEAEAWVASEFIEAERRALRRHKDR
jgi:ribosomal protein L16/L10AE